MDKKIIITVSFGTSYLDTLEKNIGSLERKIKASFTDFDVIRAFTSGIIIKKLAENGIKIFSVKEALAYAVHQGYADCVVQPTTIIAGIEYESICNDCKIFKNKFKRLHIGRPLIASTEDCIKLSDILAGSIGHTCDEAVVLMGHGSSHIMNLVYPALEYIFSQNGHDGFFVGTVEAYPTVEDVIERVKKEGYKKALLTPLMLVAGDHAQNDMAGSGESWLTSFEKAGIKTRTLIKGLGEYGKVTDMYIEHMKNDGI